MSKTITLVLALVFLMSALAFGQENPARMTTVDNLKAAFEGETTASAKYAAYAAKAAEEGYSNVSKLFEAASKAEGIHASNHKAVLAQLGIEAPEVTPEFEVKTTVENLEDAIKGESYEVDTMYPDFLKNASASKISIAAISLNYAYETEKVHKMLYTKALAAIQAGSEDVLSGNYAVCTTCGNTYEADIPNRCGFCMTHKDRFIYIS